MYNILPPTTAITYVDQCACIKIILLFIIGARTDAFIFSFILFLSVNRIKYYAYASIHTLTHNSVCCILRINRIIIIRLLNLMLKV